MKTSFLVSLFLIIPLVGTVRHSVPPTRTQPLANLSRQAARQALLRLIQQCPPQFTAGNFRAVAAISEKGYRQAIEAGEPRIAAGFLNNLGSCNFALHKYREAVKVYLEAGRLAEAAGDLNTAGKLDFNISSLYSQLGEVDAAVESARRAMQRLTGEERSRQLPKLLIHLATLRARQERVPESLSLFEEGIAAARRNNDAEMYAIGWNDLGEEWLNRKQLANAEHALLEAYRIRKLHRLRSIESSYRNLGMLRLEQGHLRSAHTLLNEAVELSRRPGGLLPSWHVYYARGRARMALNQLPAALTDLRVAARLARTWRRSAPPGDATRVSAENEIQSVHSALVEAANKLYFTQGGASLVRETFEAAEANRAASLRALVADPRDCRRELPAEYWATLRELESAEVDLLRGDKSDAPERIERLNGALNQWEAGTGANTDLEPSGLLESTRAHLGQDGTFLAFHLASPDSYLWAVSREGFELYRLPAAAEIGRLANRFESAVREGRPEQTKLGYLLYRTLFGPLARAFVQKKRWLLALDTRLFELPFAALVVHGAASRPAYLVERHSLEVVPGAGMLALAGATRQPLSGTFLGIADPVYNEADPRWPEIAQPSRGLLSLLRLPLARAGSPNAVDLELARLAGSAREVEACAAAWGGTRPPIWLRGAAAARSGLEAALPSQPAVLHFATHVLRSGQRLHSGLIVLSLRADGQHEVLGPAEIATMPLRGALVVMSGCSSGSAEALPGTGLTGLTRAWQAAGARAVVATLWPGADGGGPLFLSFYRHLRETQGAGPAVALQLAQLDMLRSHDWRSNPHYWGAYFISGNQL